MLAAPAAQRGGGGGASRDRKDGAMSWRFAFLSVGALLHLGSIAALADSDVTFEARVRPILTAHCFQCHGEG